MRDDPFSIKGSNDGLLLSIDTSESWQTVTRALADKLDARKQAFAGAIFKVELWERTVAKSELRTLRAILERRGVTLSLVRSASESSLEAAKALDLPTELSKRRQARRRRAKSSPKTVLRKMALGNSEEAGSPGIMFRRTLRSGRTIHSDGHAIVFGDVNPGAEVSAVGDIVVWGSLRGVAHAGSAGDETAVVCALEMRPSQLKIAGLTLSQDSAKHQQRRPAIARIHDQKIIVKAGD